MARIADEELARIKSEVSVAALAEAAGVKLTKQGRDLIGCCPFHDDKSPSLVITASKNLWHCLGACNSGGSVIDWVMAAEGVSFRHAVELLRQGHVSSLAASGRRPPKRSTVPKLTSPFEVFADDQVLLSQVVDYYHQTLLGSEDALAYLEKRGLREDKLIENFRLGYANRTLGYRLPEKNRVAGKEVRERLQALGIIRESGHEHFAGSLVIPVISAEGEIKEVYGRKIRDNLKAGTAYHLYLPGPHAGVFNEAGIAGEKEVVLCESLIDALSFIAAGVINTTASFGVSVFTDEILDLLVTGRCERVLIAYDADQAGDLAAEAVAEKLCSAGIDAYRTKLPGGMDVNEYARKVTPAKRSLGLVVSGAEWMGKAPAPRPQGDPASAAETREAPRRPGEVEERLIGSEAEIRVGGRAWRVRGLEANATPNQMKVNLACFAGDGFFVDSLDLYSARARSAYSRAAAAELGLQDEVIRRDLGRVVISCEGFQDQLIAVAAEANAAPEMGDAERDAALELLQTPGLIDKVRADLDEIGIVGEKENKLICYLAAVSRLDDHPLSVIIQSSAAAGKSSLQDGILSLLPKEARVVFSAMTGQSLFYMGEEDLEHKCLAIAEEEGAARAAYSIKILSSEGELKLASVGKDPDTGKHTTHTYLVKGPAAIFLTTTSPEIEDEIASRAIVIAVAEDSDQTRAIQAAQRRAETLSGLIAKARRAEITTLHQNAQRLLAPIAVVNPFAEELDFSDRRARARRDHAKYLALIRAIALLHQHQREKKSVKVAGKEIVYIEATRDDVALANELAKTAFARSLDELAPQTRRLLVLISEMAPRARDAGNAEYRFTRKDVRAYTAWSDFQVRTHLGRLVEMEYVAAHSGRRGQAFEYELVAEAADDGAPALIDLGDGEKFEGGLRGVGGGVEPGSRITSSPPDPSSEPVSAKFAVESATELGRKDEKLASYPHLEEAAG